MPDSMSCSKNGGNSMVIGKQSLSLIVLSLALSCVSNDVFAQTTGSSLISALPSDRIFPLIGPSLGCSCAVFRRGAQSPAKSVVLSILSTDGPPRARAWISGKEVELKHTRRSGNLSDPRATVTNVYATSSATITLRSRAISFDSACRAYPDIPSEGSCFTGSLIVSEGKKTENIPVTEICGC